MRLGDFVFLGVALLTLAVFACIGWLIWDELTAEKFSLRKDSWTCTRSHTETNYTYTQVGNTTIPIPYYTEVCDQWTRT